MKFNATLYCRYMPAVIAGVMSSACGPGNETNQHTVVDDSMAMRHTVVPDSPMLVPGESAGAFKLEEAASSMQELLGQPDYSDAAMGKAVLLWYTDTARTYPLSVFTARDMGNDETARIKQIRVTSSIFQTGESLGVGSVLAEIRNQYPVAPVETYEAHGETYTIYDSDEGIAFEVGPDERCVAIIIHAADAETSTYLPLRPVD